MVSVALAYLHPGAVAHSFMASVLQVTRAHPDLTVWPIRTGPLAVPKSRNAAAARLLESDLEWLWFVDTDIGFPASMLTNLLAVADEQDRPVVTGVCMAVVDGEYDGMGGNHQQLQLALYQRDGDQYRSLPERPGPEQLVRVDGCGAAMLLIHRSVLERIDRDPFDRLGLLGEDLSFCRRLEDKGIPVHTHGGLSTTHYKPIYIG